MPTHNLHNAPAWTAGAFSLGQRCTNAGNAYQCTRAGASTAAPTGTAAAINNGGAAVFRYLSPADFGGDFQNWVRANQGTLTQPHTIQWWNDLPGKTWPPPGPIKGISNGPTTGITLTAAPGEGFADHPNRANHPLRFNPGYGVAFYVKEGDAILDSFADAVTVTNWQTKNGSLNRGTTNIWLHGKHSTVSSTLNWCAPINDGTGIAFHPKDAVNSTIVCTNNVLIEGRGDNGNSGVAVDQCSNHTAIENNTFICPANYHGTVETGGIIATYCASGMTVRNNAFFGIQYPINMIRSDAVADGHNATDALGAQKFVVSGGRGAMQDLLTLPFDTTTFVQPSNAGGLLDVRVPGGSPLLGAGTSSVLDTADIYGTRRPQGRGFTIGAYERTAGASGALDKLLTIVGATALLGQNPRLPRRGLFAALARLLTWWRAA